MELADSFLKHFSDMKDFRIQNHNFRHNLKDIFIIAILGTICGADGWLEIERFGQAKEDWLKTFLELPNGIPSHDTFGRVFSLLDPKVFENCFLNWLKSLSIDLTKEIIALDGKTVRGSGNKKQKEPALHLVSAWAAKNRMMLAQVKTQDKSRLCRYLVMNFTPPCLKFTRQRDRLSGHSRPVSLTNPYDTSVHTDSRLPQ